MRNQWERGDGKDMLDAVGKWRYNYENKMARNILRTSAYIVDQTMTLTIRERSNHSYS